VPKKGEGLALPAGVLARSEMGRNALLEKGRMRTETQGRGHGSRGPS
jgi:hypothetical protein